MRLVKLDGIRVNPEHVIDVEQTDMGQTRITTVGLVDGGEGFAVSAEIIVPQTEEEVARLLAGGEAREPMLREIDMNALRLHNEFLTAEVERLKGLLAASTPAPEPEETDEPRCNSCGDKGRVKVPLTGAPIPMMAMVHCDDCVDDCDGVGCTRPECARCGSCGDRIVNDLCGCDDDDEPAPAAPTEPEIPGEAVVVTPDGTETTHDTIGGALDAAQPGDEVRIQPKTTTVPLRSRVTAEVHGECVVQPELGPRAERTVWVRETTRIVVSAPDGLDLHHRGYDEPTDWSEDMLPSDLGSVNLMHQSPGDFVHYLWTSDPAIDVSQHKDLKYPPDACVLHVRVVPDDQPLAAPFPGFTSAPTDPALFDPDAILAAVRDDPEADRQVALMGRYGTHWHWRRHQEQWAGSNFAGLLFDPTQDDLRKRFTDGNQGFDALGDAVLILMSDEARPMQWDQGKEDVMKILQSKLTDNPLCMTPFGLVGKSWDAPSPFRHWWGRAMYRSFVDVVDLALAYKLLQDVGLVSAVLSPQDEAHVRENFRRFAAHVEADMAVSAPRMWRTANVLAVECVRHLFPSLGLPDLSHHLTRPAAVLRPTDPPTWGDRGDYTGANMMGICYSVYLWCRGDFQDDHIEHAVAIWTGDIASWMPAEVKGTDPGNGDLFSCHRFTDSLTELWFPTGRDPVSLGSQDHALFVVRNARDGGGA